VNELLNDGHSATALVDAVAVLRRIEKDAHVFCNTEDEQKFLVDFLSRIIADWESDLRSDH
jgi:hypothetical protein